MSNSRRSKRLRVAAAPLPADTRLAEPRIHNGDLLNTLPTVILSSILFELIGDGPISMSAVAMLCRNIRVMVVDHVDKFTVPGARVSAARLRSLRVSFPRVRQLSIINSQKLAKVSMIELGSMHQLTHLDLHGCMFAPHLIQHLAPLRHLQSLNLADVYLGRQADLMMLSQMKSLTDLNLRDCGVLCSSLVQFLAPLTQLRSLDLSLMPGTLPPCPFLPNLTQLVKLKIHGADFLPMQDSCYFLRHFAQLEWLDISKSSRSRPSRQTFAHIPTSLRHLAASGYETSHEMYENLSRCSQLTYLDMFCRFARHSWDLVSPISFSLLSSLTCLRIFIPPLVRQPSDALNVLNTLTSLTELTLQLVGGPFFPLRSLAALRNLKHLSVRHLENTQSDGIESLDLPTLFPHLRSLEVISYSFAHPELASLLLFTQLTCLRLVNSCHIPVRNDTLEVFVQLPNLTVLDLDVVAITCVTESGIQHLQRLCPKLTVQYRLTLDALDEDP